MPTVIKEDGFQVRIYTADHEPYHVHVFKGEGEAKIYLGSGIEKPSFAWTEKMSRKDAKKALALVTDHQSFLVAKWKEIYGE